jgi:DNA-directed RNA polymerase subunit H (RpoH/RPB5)
VVSSRLRGSLAHEAVSSHHVVTREAVSSQLKEMEMSGYETKRRVN